MKRRVSTIIGLGLLLATRVMAAEPITVDGTRVTVSTDRYRVVFDGLNLIHLENRLTGETYDAPATPASETAALRALAGRTGIAIDSLRPAIPIKYYTLCNRTKATSEKTATGLRMTYEGLEVKGSDRSAGASASGAPRPVVEDGAKVGDAGGGSAEIRDTDVGEGGPVTTNVQEDVTAYAISNPPDFEPAMRLVVTFAVEAGTGDLVITPDAHGNIEKVSGVRDRGVLRTAIQAPNLAGDLRVILPADHGVAYTADTVPPAWSVKPASFRWPHRWEAGLFIAEGRKGSVGIWADEPGLRYGRLLTVARSTTAWATVLEFETTDMNYRCNDLTNAAWRLNVFAGNWTRAAGRYRGQMVAQWPDLKPLAERKPAWADAVRLVVEPALPDPAMTAELAALPRDRAAVFCREGWALNPGAFRQQPPTRLDTLWPSARPWGFTMPTNLPERVAALEAQGIHVFAYANQNLIGSGSWVMQPIGYEPPFREEGGYLYTWRPFARFFPEACRDHIQKIGAGGLCEGFSWVMRRHLGGEPADENWFTGSLGMRAYLRELLPGTALMGDQVNEVTCRGQHLSRAVTADLRHAHPVSTYLFGPFTRQWSGAMDPAAMAADDIHGFLPGWPASWGPATPMVQAMVPSKGLQWQGGRTALVPAVQSLLRKRGELFAKAGLESVWPETWDPRVLHYYRGKDGAEYRLLADQGTRLVKVVGDNEETLYWLTGGAGEADLKGYVIPNWVAYTGDKAIGLNPDAVYVTEAGGERPAVSISALPQGTMVSRTLHGAGWWLVDVRSKGEMKVGPAVPCRPDAAGAVDEKTAGKGLPALPEEGCTVTVRVRSADKPVSFAGADAIKELAPRDYEVSMNVPGSLVAYWEKPGRVLLATNDACRLTLSSPPSGLESSVAAMLPVKGTLVPPVGCAESGEESSIAWLVRLPIEQPWLVFKFGAGTEAFTQGVRYSVRVNGRTVWERLRTETELKWVGDGMKLVAKPVRYGAVNVKEYEDKTVLLELVAAARDAGLGNVVSWEDPRLLEQPPTWDAELDKPAEAPKLDEVPGIELGK